MAKLYKIEYYVSHDKDLVEKGLEMDLHIVEEYSSSLKAIKRFDGCWLSECIARIYEDEKGVKIWSRDEVADYGAILHRWEGMENEVWVEYSHHWDGKDYTYRSTKDLYLKMCELHGVTPPEDYEKTILDDEHILHDSYGCHGGFWLECWFDGFPGEGPESCFTMRIRYSEQISEQLKSLSEEWTMDCEPVRLKEQFDDYIDGK